MLRDDPTALRRDLVELWRRQPRFYCLNDDLGTAPSSESRSLVACFLQCSFPRRSELELSY
jgi:hypothetical protein